MSVDAFVTSGSSPGLAVRAPVSSVPPPSSRIALLGFGTVGQALAQRLGGCPPAGLQLTHIFNRRIEELNAALRRIGERSFNVRPPIGLPILEQ